MPRQKQDTIRLAELASIEHEPVTWCNDLISSPISCSLLERRVMYFITGVVKHKYVENGLNVPENWKELYFYMTDRDLGIIGGQKNIRYTYDVRSFPSLITGRTAVSSWAVYTGWTHSSTTRRRTSTPSESHRRLCRC